MKKYLLLLSLLAPLLLGTSSSSVRFSTVGNLGGYQGSDPTSYTPTFTGFGTVSTQSFRWSRIGPFVLVQGTFTAGTVAGTLAGVSLPSGLTADASLGTNQVVGSYAVNVAATGHFNTLISGGGTSIGVGYTDAGGSGGIAPNNGNVVAATGNLISINALIPISGWSSATPGGTGIRCQLAYDSPNGHDATNTKVRKWTNNRASTGSCFTDTATSNGKVTVVTPGTYCVDYHDASSAGQANMGIVQSGTAGTTNVRLLTYAQGLRALGATPAANLSNSVSWCGYFANGDYVWFQDDGGADTTNSQGMFTITSVGF